MKITKNTFIDILGLPEWDDRVIEVLEALELQRPVVEDGEVYAYLSSDKYGVDIMFDYDCITEEQKAMEKDRNLYISQITLNETFSFNLPYNLNFKLNYMTVVNLLGKETDTEEEYRDETCEWEFINNENVPYTFYIVFKNKELKSIKNIWMRVQLPLDLL